MRIKQNRINKHQNYKIMKTIIALFIAVFFLSTGSSFAKGNDKLYNNVIVNKEKQTVTTTICRGQDDMNLVPLTQHVLKNDKVGKPLERISYKWDARKKRWIAVQKYTYEYHNNGRLATIYYSEWNKSTKSWGGDIQYATYVYGSNDNLTSVLGNNRVEDFDLSLK